LSALVLKRASASRPSGEWNDDDFDVLADGVVIGRILKVHAAPVGSRGCGRWPLDIMRTARQRTAMLRHAKRQWRHSQIVGGGSETIRLLVAQKVAESLSAKYIRIALAIFRKLDDSFGYDVVVSRIVHPFGWVSGARTKHGRK